VRDARDAYRFHPTGEVEQSGAGDGSAERTSRILRVP
jgi:hypothetical protein